MIKYLTAFLIGILLQTSLMAEGDFDYTISLEPVNIPNLPGLHSYAYGQHGSKWLIVGGRKDGLHARQPFNAFPTAHNNMSIYVIDIETKELWETSISSLSTNLAEQLQATNLNFYQQEDTLYIIGGYAYSNSNADHVTFPFLTTIQVSSLINDVLNGTSIAQNFRQVSDSIFAVTGGQLGMIGNSFYLVGGHRFDGRYNPMGHATYTQSYTNQIRKFKIDNSGPIPAMYDYTTITDPVHLHRRDYNLLPQIFSDGTFGYTISSGVFQVNVDLPFLYPVNITANGYTPMPSFNQYLNNYHTATACLYDSANNEMHSIFFGGMSQYYYQNGSLIQDDLVPFVKTISRLTRHSDGNLEEFQMPEEMPGLKGASAEFIPSYQVSMYDREIIKFNHLQDTAIIGHIYGGILSPSLNPFSVNQTNTTSADNNIYAVKLIKSATTNVHQIDGKNPYSLNVFPNPTGDNISIAFNDKNFKTAYYYLTSIKGKIIDQGYLNNNSGDQKSALIPLPSSLNDQTIFLTISIDNKYFITKKVFKQ